MLQKSFVLLFIFLSHLLFGQCDTALLNLGEDVILCPGQNLTLNIDPTFSSILWSDGSSSSQKTINQVGVYSVIATTIGSNLVVNGDFESNTNSFTSDYIEGSVSGGGAWGDLSQSSTYEVTTSPDLVHFNFSPCSYDGNMLVVNGASIPNSNVWCQTIAVTQQTQYQFSAFASNALFDFNVAQLQFFINGSQIGNIFTTSSNACEWSEFADTWQSDFSNTAQICIVNQNIDDGGNDFALDNITFAPICILKDTIVISTPEPLNFSLGNDLQICGSDPINLTFDYSASGYTFIWNDNNTSNIKQINDPGVYSAIVSNGCQSITDSLNITLIQGPPLINFTSDIILCPNDPATVSINYASQETLSYFWTINDLAFSTSSINNTITLNPSENSKICVNTIWSCGQLNECMQINIDEVHAAFKILANYDEKLKIAVQDLSTSNSGINSWFWTAMGSQELISTVQDASFIYDSVGGFEVSLLVTSNIGCKDSITQIIPPKTWDNIFIPNTFTPDGNKYNNTWYYVIEGIDPNTFLMQVFDRWGELIWESKDPLEYWNGFYHSTLVASSIYNWKLQYKISGQSFEKSGHLNILY